MQADWLGGVLHGAGCRVVEHDGWRQRGHGDFSDLRSVVWHHDASPVGPSPGVPGFMLRNWAKASANCWVALDGTWHLLAAGVAYHAGKVLPGKPDNFESIGVETDHTTGETWSGVVLLDSLRRGTAGILARLEVDQTGLEFHKTVCSPPGRKTDPDGLVLPVERAAVRSLLTPTHPQEDLLMAAALNDDDARRALILDWYLADLGRLPDPADVEGHLKVFRANGAYACRQGIAGSPEAAKRRKKAA